MRFNPKARVDPGQIDVRGPGSGGGGFGGGGGGMRIPIPTGGRFGWSTIVIIVLYVAIQMCSGNSVIPGTGDSGSPSRPSQQPGAGGDASTCTGEQANAEGYDCEAELLTVSVQDYWGRVFQEQAGRSYQDTRTVMFSGSTSSGCGQASSSMGPFYCPNDRLVYIDSSFMNQMLQGQLGARGGSFALGYVIAHEYGHHIENLLGVLGKARTQQGADSDSVRIELMADCLAGMWAKDASTTKDAQGQVIIEDLTRDDISRAIDAAQHVGDDYIQKKSGGQVNSEAWTHGSSAQREKWFNVGLQEGSLKACDTWSAGAL